MKKLLILLSSIVTISSSSVLTVSCDNNSSTKKNLNLDELKSDMSKDNDMSLDQSDDKAEILKNLNYQAQQGVTSDLDQGISITLKDENPKSNNNNYMPGDKLDIVLDINNNKYFNNLNAKFQFQLRKVFFNTHFVFKMSEGENIYNNVCQTVMNRYKNFYDNQSELASDGVNIKIYNNKQEVSTNTKFDITKTYSVSITINNSKYFNDMDEYNYGNINATKLDFTNKIVFTLNDSDYILASIRDQIAKNSSYDNCPAIYQNADDVAKDQNLKIEVSASDQSVINEQTKVDPKVSYNVTMVFKNDAYFNDANLDYGKAINQKEDLSKKLTFSLSTESSIYSDIQNELAKQLVINGVQLYSDGDELNEDSSIKIVINDETTKKIVGINDKTNMNDQYSLSIAINNNKYINDTASPVAFAITLNKVDFKDQKLNLTVAYGKTIQTSIYDEIASQVKVNGQAIFESASAISSTTGFSVAIYDQDGNLIHPDDKVVKRQTYSVQIKINGNSDFDNGSYKFSAPIQKPNMPTIKFDFKEGDVLLSTIRTQIANQAVLNGKKVYSNGDAVKADKSIKIFISNKKGEMINEFTKVDISNGYSIKISISSDNISFAKQDQTSDAVLEKGKLTTDMKFNLEAGDALLNTFRVQLSKQLTVNGVRVYDNPRVLGSDTSLQFVVTDKDGKVQDANSVVKAGMTYSIKITATDENVWFIPGSVEYKNITVSK